MSSIAELCSHMQSRGAAFGQKKVSTITAGYTYTARSIEPGKLLAERQERVFELISVNAAGLVFVEKIKCLLEHVHIHSGCLARRNLVLTSTKSVSELRVLDAHDDSQYIGPEMLQTLIRFQTLAVTAIERFHRRCGTSEPRVLHCLLSSQSLRGICVQKTRQKILGRRRETPVPFVLDCM